MNWNIEGCIKWKIVAKFDALRPKVYSHIIVIKIKMQKTQKNV